MTDNRSKRPRRRLRLFLGIVLTLIGLVITATWVVVRHVAPRMIVEPTRTNADAPLPPGFVPRSFQVGNRLELAAWEAHPVNQPATAILVLHGIADSKSSQQGTIRMLADRGILGITPDLRAHGDSGGLASYGFHEKHDLARIVDTIETEHPGIQIGLWGTSYGGAVALQAASYDPRIDFVIVESTFADLTGIARSQVRSHTSLPLEWLAPIALERAGKIANFNPLEVSPAEAISTLEIPVLHFHGSDDIVIPFQHAEDIRDRAKRPDYRFVPIDGGGHYNLSITAPDTYHNEIDTFLSGVLPQDSE